MATVVPFVPPPYPYERLDALKRVADALPGGVVDCSIGTPCDPVPDLVARAAADAATRSMGYPPSAGTAALHEAAAEWMQRAMGVTVPPAEIAACVGTKEMVASLPQFLALRRPDRDTVLYPAVAYPSYEMGATLAGKRAVAVPLDAEWHLDLDAIEPADAERALVLWINEPGNPSSSVADTAYLERVAQWGRAHGVLVASDECYVEFAPKPNTILGAGLDGVLAVHSLSKRSNLAGMRVGFYAGDPDLVEYLVETRKHAGFMVPTMTQAAAVAALGDDAHVEVQRRRYAERRELAIDRLEAVGLHHVGGPMLFYLWLRDDAGSGGWQIADRLSRSGLLVSPGDFYGEAGARYARLAAVQPRERLEPALDRLVKGKRVSSDLAATITKLWEAGADFESVLPRAQAHDAVRAAIDMLDRGEARVAEVIDDEVVVHEWAKQAVLLWFRLQELEQIDVGPFEYVDRLPLKRNYREAGVRVVPGAQARFGSFLARGVILMPSYVNIGAYVDEGTMVDTWATVGSCAQIGKRVHLAGGVGIGGVLEPPQAKPVVIEDDVFVGSRCMIVGGARVRRGAALGAGVILTASIPVIDAETGEEISRGDVPERALAVQATRPREFPGGTFGLPCVLVLRTLPEGQGHDDLQLNSMLREHGIIS